MELLDGSTDFDGSIAGADLVVESGPEDLAWKQELVCAHGRPGGAGCGAGVEHLGPEHHCDRRAAARGPSAC